MDPQAAVQTGATLRAVSPDFSSLSSDELQQLELVLQRQALIEDEQTQRLAGLRRTMLHLQQQIDNEQKRSRKLSSSTPRNSSPTQQNQPKLASSDIVQCYICLSTIDVQANTCNISPPVLCSDCHRPVCRRCGNYTSPEFFVSQYSVRCENQIRSSKWRCRMCIVRREVVRKSGTWNMTDNETPAHSPVRLLQKLAAYRASGASSSVSSSPSPSPQNGRHSSILAESTNFFARLWRTSTQHSSSPPTLIDANKIDLTSFDQIPEPSSFILVDEQVKLSSSAVAKRRMSFMRNATTKNSTSNQYPLNLLSVALTESPASLLRPEPTMSSTITDPSIEDTTSEKLFDTNSELLSQSLETNMDASNPHSMDDQDDLGNIQKISATFIERQKKLDLNSKPTSSFVEQLPSLTMQAMKQQRHESFLSPEHTIDVSSAMDFSSVIIMAEQSTTKNRISSLLTGNESASVDTSQINDNHITPRINRANLRSSDTWARKRALLHRSYQWTTTMDKDASLKNKNHPIEENDSSNHGKNLTDSTSRSLIPLNKETSSSTSQSAITENAETVALNHHSSNEWIRQRLSFRRLPEIPTNILNQKNSFNTEAIIEDVNFTSSSHSSTDCSYQAIRENSLSNHSNRSKSIDSESSVKSRSSQGKLVQAYQAKAAKSIDVSHLVRQKSFLVVNNTLLPQRSIDYPCIVRKTQDYSDIVRARILYTKLNKSQQVNQFSLSLEREHIPKVPRKIIIRQDNSIEIALSQPPKLRRNTLSEDYHHGHNSEADYSATQSGSGASTLGLPVSASISSSICGDRRKTIETCENIYLHAEESSKLRARTPPSNPHRILLHRDKNDASIRTNGLGMRILGGQECEDGSLGCFVTNLIPGGPADVQGNIEVGDQILEFNGNSLIDSTYEEVRMLQDQCGDIVQLVVQHNNVRLQINGGQALSSIEVSRHFETVPRLASSLTRKRRNLPPLPSSLSSSFPKQPKRQLYETVETLEVPSVKELKPILINRGRLLAQIWHDVEDMKLALTIIQASNLPLRSNGDLPYAYITGKMLFEDRGFDMFETKVIHSSNPVYNETFVFHEVDTVNVLHLEILLWDKKNYLSTSRKSTGNINDHASEMDASDDFIGMVQLPLNEANLEDEPRWYELRDRQTRKTSASSVTFKYSSAESNESCRKMPPLLPSTNVHHEQNKLLNDTLTGPSHKTATIKNELKSNSLLTKRKHSVVQVLHQSPNRKSRQRASIAGFLTSSIKISKNDSDEHEDNVDDDSSNGSLRNKGSTQQEQPRRQSAIVLQSEKIKRQISKGLSKLFDSRPRRFSELTSKSQPQSPSKQVTTQKSASVDLEDDISPIVSTSIDSPNNILNKSPRQSIISTTNQDEHQSLSMRSIPLQQMPIGQLMLPYIPSSRHSSISGSRKSSAASYCESDDDIDRYFTFPEQLQQEQTNDANNFQTHMAGPGQVTPRNYENMINDFIHMGQIQIGLIVSKGLLEIDIICARGLQKILDDASNQGVAHEDNPPDTYVKTYLRTGTRRVQKRKTAIVKASYNPDYNAKLKYNACNVMGRRLQVTVWQRAPKFEKNQCIGEVFIQLDNLTLTQLTLAWYKLFREKTVESEFYDSS